MWFYKLLDQLTLVGISAIFLVLVVGLVFLFKVILDNSGNKIIAQNAHDTEYLEKKHWAVDINKYKSLLSNLALILSLGFCLLAFEYPTFEAVSLADLGTLEAVTEEQIEIPQTQQTQPPPPKITLPEIVEVPDETEIKNEIEVDLSDEIDQKTVVQEVAETVVEEEPEEDIEQVFTIVEEQAAPDGGMNTFYEYIKKNLEYPRQAKRMNVQGKVFLEFIVDRDGTITDIKVVRGIGAGCDEEAMRILKESPKWKPAKQRGRSVRQKMTFPINFKLQ